VLTIAPAGGAAITYLALELDWRDSWISVVFDTSQSRLIKLEPAG